MLHIVLIEPQLPENIGAVARAMFNFNCTLLTLVNPKKPPTHPNAIANSAGADDVLHNARIVESLEEAVAHDQQVIGFAAGARDMVHVYDALTPNVCEPWNTLKTALVFGCERSGLTNDSMAACHKIIRIATNPDFSSLNLAQAVTLACGTWFAHHTQPITEWVTGKSEWAEAQELTSLLNDLENRLDKAEYWQVEHKKPTMWRNLKNLFWRMPLTSQEVRTLRGMIRTLDES